MKRKIVKILLIAILVLALTISASCTSVSEKEFVPNFSKERMIETISVLSAEDGGRIAGFAGEEEAAEYISKQFKEAGLKVSEQSFPVKAFECKNVSFTVPSEVAIGKAKALTFSASTPSGGITAEVIPLGMGTADDYKDKDVTGKIALITRGGEYFYVKTARAYEMGAVAVVFYDPNSDSAISATLTQLSAVPAISISSTDALMIENNINMGQKIEAAIEVDSINEDSSSLNIIGLYKSSDNPYGKCIIIGAHYDGVDTPAANDNASGVSVIIEIAKELVRQKVKLPYDIKFIAFGAEEIGLIGSSAYVNEMSATERNSVLAMLNLDMVGAGDSFILFTTDENSSTELLDETKESLRQMGYEAETLITDRSDHTPFSYAGIQAVYIQVGPFEDYHTDLDNIEVIEPEMLVKVCELCTRILIDELPEWVK